MAEPNSPIVFDEARAESYEQRFARLRPLVDALHLGLRVAFADLPTNARVVCVGAGTGAELLALAEAFPDFRFTAVDPSVPMLNLARRRAEQHGFADRCSFHEGTLDTLPDTEPFDAATSILVSHFLLDRAARVGFFAEIARRLRPGAKLVSADLAAGPSAETLEPLFEPWAHLLRHTGLDEQELVEYRANFGTKVSVLTGPEVAAVIADAGFEPPLQFFQGVMIHAWSTVIESSPISDR